MSCNPEWCLTCRFIEYCGGQNILQSFEAPQARATVRTVETRLKQIIGEVASELNIQILALEVMPDHLHLFVSSRPELCLTHIVKAMKGRSSRVLREEFPDLQRMPSLWTHSYFVSTAGNVSADTIKKYIEEQKTRD